MNDDGEEKDDCKRKSRNLSEKKRRDQFNLLVNELSSMVSSSNRKMDKSTVLKSTITFLKQHNEIADQSRVHEIKENWKPSFLSNEEFTHLILEALDGFIMVFSSTGRILYSSESITSLIGHLPSDLLNMTIYDLAFEEDHSDIYNILLNPVSVVDPVEDGLTADNQICFNCHLKRGGFDFWEEVRYELVQFIGYFKTMILPTTNNAEFLGDADSKIIFVGTSRIQTPQLIREMSIIGSTKIEFTSRHSLEWKFLFLDHRAPPIIGYLPFEVLGTSGYDYYHFDDLEKVILCHEALKLKGEGTSCYYRFLAKGQQWLWLQTRYYITYHQWTSKPEFVVCTHRVINYADVVKQQRNNSNNCGGENDPNEVNNDSDSVTDRQLHTTASMVVSSPWSSRSSQVRFGNKSVSPKAKRRNRHHTYHGTGSDTTSMSADSPTSRYSMMTQSSSRSKLRPSSQSLKASPQHQPNMQQMIPDTFQQMQPVPTTQIIGPAFLEPPQYLAAIPVQPVLAHGFTATNAVLSPLQPSSDLVHQSLVMTENISQDQLQRKHEQLQAVIAHQQDELRRVSEQLLMARYGLPLVNVSIPYSNSLTTTDSNRPLVNPQNQHQNQHQQQTHILSSEDYQPQHHMQHQRHLENEQQIINYVQMGQSDANEEIISYMHLTPLSTDHNMQQNHTLLLRDDASSEILQQSHSVASDLEILPYHNMGSNQVQIEFTTTSSTSHIQ